MARRRGLEAAEFEVLERGGRGRGPAAARCAAGAAWVLYVGRKEDNSGEENSDKDVRVQGPWVVVLLWLTVHLFRLSQQQTLDGHGDVGLEGSLCCECYLSCVPGCVPWSVDE